ncbi:caspase-10-like [Engraulis encrasicolus]|uniref:caspase-10-like n=1 Tax=Engraulis encrasicolus TaxID=184585 RepID=UPI002FD3A928
MNKGDPQCKDFISLLREDLMLDEFPGLRSLLLSAPAAPNQVAAGAAASDTPVQQAGLERYKMNHSPRGICVIINNVDFVKKEKKRHGSDKDADALKNVFTWLGFTVESHKNKTVDEMKRVLQDCSKRAGGDCFICCVLSHGGSKGVSGCDDEVLPMEEILKPFRGHVCPGLVGKPKLFFIQACRGGGIQEEARLTMDSIMEVSQDVDDKPLQITISADADFLVCRSTVDGYAAMRHRDYGSWFIQSLCKHFEKDVPSHDILDILLWVNAEVSQKEANITLQGQRRKARQISEQTSRLRKKLVFPVPHN